MIKKFFQNNMDKEKILITHGQCSDGFGAAWSVWKKYGDDIKYYFSNHNEPPMTFENKKILFTDFAYKRKHMIELSKKNEVFVIDHHFYALHDLKGLNNTFFDLSKSGAVLAWENTFSDKKVPLILKYVEDRDLIKYEMPYSLEILSVLDTIPKDFESWNYFENELENNFDEILQEGVFLRREFEKKLNELTKTPIIVNIDGNLGLAVNAEKWDFASYAAEKISENANFGMSWFKNEKNEIKCSFRSKNGFDVNKLAIKIGGGGHQNSAGATINENLLNDILNNKQRKKVIYKL